MDVRKELEALYERCKRELECTPVGEPGREVALISNATDLLCQIATWDAAHELHMTFEPEEDTDNGFLVVVPWSGYGSVD